MSRAERFLEGFKLGSLGVSKKPKVALEEPIAPEPWKISPIKILKEGFTDEDFEKCPFFLWEEDLSMRYAFVISGPVKPLQFGIWFYGGNNLEYVPDGLFGNGVYFFRGYDFLKLEEGRFSYNSVLQRFEKYCELVKTKGIAGFIATLPPFKKNTLTNLKYNAWLKGKKKQLGVK